MRIDHRNGTVHFGSQQLETDKIRNHLSMLAKRLAKAATMIDPTPPSSAEGRRKEAIKIAKEELTHEHKRAVARKHLIEKRKEQLEQALMEQVSMAAA